MTCPHGLTFSLCFFPSMLALGPHLLLCFHMDAIGMVNVSVPMGFTKLTAGARHTCNVAAALGVPDFGFVMSLASSSKEVSGRIKVLP